MPISDIYGLKAAMDNIAADKDLIKRHARIANATRKAIEAFGLKLHLESGFSDTVTVFDVPEGMTADDILERMRKTWNHAGRFFRRIGRKSHSNRAYGCKCKCRRYVRSDVWIGRNIEISWMEIRE